MGLNFSNSVYFIQENEIDVSVQLLLSFDGDFNQSFEVEFITLNNTAEGNACVIDRYITDLGCFCLFVCRWQGL